MTRKPLTFIAVAAALTLSAGTSFASGSDADGGAETGDEIGRAHV